MRRTAIGTIVMSRVEYTGGRSYPRGFITLLTEDEEYVTLDVDAYTEYETLDEGTRVLASCELLEGTGVWAARRIHKIEEAEIRSRETSGA